MSISFWKKTIQFLKKGLFEWIQWCAVNIIDHILSFFCICMIPHYYYSQNSYLVTLLHHFSHFIILILIIYFLYTTYIPFLSSPCFFNNQISFQLPSTFIIILLASATYFRFNLFFTFSSYIFLYIYYQVIRFLDITIITSNVVALFWSFFYLLRII